ncbi:MAG: hypothetical protein V3T01_10825 [Myxococcota bacterium]
MGDREHPVWERPLRQALANAPDPEQATRSAERLLATPLPDGGLVADRLAMLAGERGEKIARILHAVCGIAPFLAAFLQRHPEWLFELLDDALENPRQRDDLAERLDTWLRRDAEQEPGLILRRFKYFELARLSIRDACDAWVPLSESDVTLRGLSDLADVILERALCIAAEELLETAGPARWRSAEGDAVELSFCVLGLGKLGSRELNYSSDVDLVYIHETPPGSLSTGSSDGFASLPPLDYFARLAQQFGILVGAATAEGFLYRVDLDLRPHGAQGALVVSDEALATYYEAWADTWERAAFMKARPVAGDLSLGWRAIRRVDPMIYRSSMDYSAATSIRSLKQKVEAAKGGRKGEFNVKIDAGGIRDVEFIAQAQQLLHGGRIPQIRERSTQRSLRRLGEVGLLPVEQVDRLLEAYRFLRRVENRIQMEDEQQRHAVPKEDGALTRLARSLGFLSSDATTRFEAELRNRREVVQSLFGDAYAEGGKERILELFARNVPHLVELPATRAMIESLAEQLARSIDESPEPERSLNNLDGFIESVGSRRFYYELLIDRPELIPRLTSLFASSKYLSNYLARYPRLIERLFADPDVLLLSREALRAEYRATVGAIETEHRDSMEFELDALRIFQHCQVLNVGLLDIDGKIGRAASDAGLTEIAEVCLEEALAATERRLQQRPDGVPAAARSGAFLAVGMGKLGSRELTYGSDLDLIFLYDVPAADVARKAEAQAYYVSLAQRLISFLHTPTAEGFCYEIDARLRPSGNQGTLVTSVEAFQRYHEQEAAVWERQALLRARPVAGDHQLGETFTTLRRVILQRPLPVDLAQQVDAVRQRMESELAPETQRRRNFKTGRGGLLDVETVVQYLQLRHGGSNPELLDVARVDVLLARLAENSLLTADAATTLREGWTFLQQLSSRLRVGENRSISDFDSEGGDLEGLARRLGYGAGGARRALIADYERHTEQVRGVYEATLRPAARSSG